MIYYTRSRVEIRFEFSYPVWGIYIFLFISVRLERPISCNLGLTRPRPFGEIINTLPAGETKRGSNAGLICPVLMGGPCGKLPIPMDDFGQNGLLHNLRKGQPNWYRHGFLHLKNRGLVTNIFIR
jgi:hypothetical protein